MKYRIIKVPAGFKPQHRACFEFRWKNFFEGNCLELPDTVLLSTRADAIQFIEDYKKSKKQKESLEVVWESE